MAEYPQGMDDGPIALSPSPAPAPARGPDDTALSHLARHAEQARGAYAPNTERALLADVVTFTHPPRRLQRRHLPPHRRSAQPDR